MRRALIAITLILVGVSLSAQNFSAMSKEDANDWVYSHIKYQSYYSTLKDSQAPAVTLSIRKGNCVCMALLLQSILDEYDICVSNVILVTTPQGRHAVVETSLGTILDPVSGQEYNSLPEDWRE